MTRTPCLVSLSGPGREPLLPVSPAVLLGQVVTLVIVVVVRGDQQLADGVESAVTSRYIDGLDGLAIDGDGSTNRSWMVSTTLPGAW
jgi:hypothetical protein